MPARGPSIACALQAAPQRCRLTVHSPGARPWPVDRVRTACSAPALPANGAEEPAPPADGAEQAAPFYQGGPPPAGVLAAAGAFVRATSRGRESALMDVLMSKSPWSPEANFENACLRGVPNAKRRGEFVEKVLEGKTGRRRHGGAEASGGQRQEKTDRRTLRKSRATHRPRSDKGVHVMKNLKSSNHKP